MAQLNPNSIALPQQTGDPGISSPATRPTILANPWGSVASSQGLAAGYYARANASFMADIDSVARTFEVMAERKQNEENRTFVDRFQLDYNKRASQISTEMINSPDAGSPQFVSLLDKKLEKAQQETLNALHAEGKFSPDQSGIEAAKSAAMGVRASTARSAAVTAHNTRLGVMLENTKQNVLDIGRLTGATGDIEGGLQRAMSSINGLQPMLAPDKFMTLKRTVREQLVEDAVNGFRERGEYDRALNVLDQNRGYSGIGAQIAEVAKERGVDPALLVAVAQSESSLRNGAIPQIDPKTGRPVSGSRGLFGFLPETAREFGLPGDASTATTEQQAAAAALKIKRDQTALRGVLKRNPTPGETYLAWVLGAEGASRVLTADPNTPVSELLSAKAINANSSFLGGDRTAGDVTDFAALKMMIAGAGTGRPSRPSNENYEKAVQTLNLTPQEQYLYQTHLKNLWGPGGVNNYGKDGRIQSRSSLFQAVVEHDGRFFNIPTVWGGKKVSVEEAAHNVEQLGWDKFPSYDTAKEADARYAEMHKFMDKDTGSYFDHQRALEESDAGRFLSEDTRSKLLNSVITQRRADRDRAEKAVDKYIKQAGESYLREAYSRANGQSVDQNTHQPIPLTAEYVNSIRQYVSPAEYNGLLGLLAGGGQNDQQEAIVSLAENVDQMPPEDYQRLATSLLRTHQIKTDTFTTWVGRNRTAMQDNMPVSSYRAGLDRVKTTLNPGQLLSGPAAAIGRAALGSAVEEYTNWGASHPNPTRAEANAKAHEIIQRYQIINYSNMKMAVGVPRYMEIKPRNAITLDDVRAAEKKFTEDYRAGRLSKAEAQQQAQLLNDWNTILTQEAAMKGGVKLPPPPKPEEPAARSPFDTGAAPMQMIPGVQ